MKTREVARQDLIQESRLKHEELIPESERPSPNQYTPQTVVSPILMDQVSPPLFWLKDKRLILLIGLGMVMAMAVVWFLI
jgi:hypothetical protein